MKCKATTDVQRRLIKATTDVQRRLTKAITDVQRRLIKTIFKQILGQALLQKYYVE